MTDPLVATLARRLVDIESTVKSMNGPQLSASSIETGAITEYDEDTLVGQYGMQYDGTHVAASLGGPPPPQPTPPIVQAAGGGLLVGWDGEYAGGIFVVSPMDFARVDIAVGPVGFDPIATPPVTAITSPRGSLAFVPLEPGEYEVYLIARSLSGKASPVSISRTDNALPLADAADVAAAQAAADQAVSDALAAHILAQAGVDDAAAAAAAAQAAQDDADAANSLATLAKSTADTAITVFRQSSMPAPSANFQANDLWIDSDDGMLYVAASDTVWIQSSDQRIAAVVSSNATKTTVFAQASQPSTTGRTTGDLWIDTDDGNKLYDWSGSWTARLIGAPAISATAVDLGGAPRVVLGGTAKAFYNILTAVPVTASGVAGLIVIETPITFTTKMFSVHIKGYNYVSGRGDIDLTVSGYANSTPSLNQVGVTNAGSALVSARLARNTTTGTLAIILKSEEAGNLWAYTRFAIPEAVIGHAGGLPPDSWATGWSAALLADEAAITAGYNLTVSPTTYDAGALAAAANSLATTAKNTADSKITVYRQSSAPTGTFVVNDLWLDIDDGLVYYASTTAGAWTLHSDQRIGQVVTSNAAKTTVFAQISQPSTTGRTIGDLWIDTDDGNRLYDWSGSWTARMLGAPAISATARQLGAITVYRQSTAPASGYVVNDLWVDSDDGLLYVATSTSVWTLSADQRVATLVTSNASKITAFAQTSPPSTTGRTLGDIWIDTDDGNRPYIWEGGPSWVDRRDATIAAAASLASQAQSTAAGKITVYRQSSAPTGTFVINDLWIDTDDGMLYVATTTAGAWLASPDQRIGTVVTSNATKTTVFAQISQPSTTGRTTGDIWLDTDDGNKIYDWSGSWTVRLLGAPAISATARELGAVLIYRQSSAPTTGMVNGDMWIDSDDGLVYVRAGGVWALSDDQRIGGLVTSNSTKISMFAQTSAPTTVGRVVGDIWIDTDDGNKIYDWANPGPAWTGRLIGGSALAADAIDGKVITGALFRTAASGERIAIDQTAKRIEFYSSATDLLPVVLKAQAIGTAYTAAILRSAYLLSGGTYTKSQLKIDNQGNWYLGTYKAPTSGDLDTDSASVDGITEVRGGSLGLFMRSAYDVTVSADGFGNAYGAGLGWLYINCKAQAKQGLTVGGDAAQNKLVVSRVYGGGASTTESRTYIEDSITLGVPGPAQVTTLMRSNVEVSRMELTDDGINVPDGLQSGRMRTKMFEGDGTTAQTTSTIATMGTSGAQGTFVAPPSGAIEVTVASQLRISVAGQACTVGFEIKEGATIGAGTVFQAYDINKAVLNGNTQNIRSEATYLVTGLTPGATYNTRTVMGSTVGTATASAAWNRLILRMSP